MRATALATLALLCLSGTATAGVDLSKMSLPQAVEFVRDNTHVKGSSFGDQNTWLGPTVYEDIPTDGHPVLAALAGVSNGGGNAIVYLAAITHSDGTAPDVSIVIMLSYSGNSWNFYDTATLPDGTPLPLNVADRQVVDCIGDGCDYSETIIVDLSPAVLAAHLNDNPFQVRIGGRNHSNVFGLTQGYIAGFEAALPGGTPAAEPSSVVFGAGHFPEVSTPQAAPSLTLIGHPGSQSLGVQFNPVPAMMAKLLKAPPRQGVWVMSVTPGLPAAKAGLKVGDVILSFDGKPITSSADLVADVKAVHAGQQVVIAVVQGGVVNTTTVTF